MEKRHNKVRTLKDERNGRTMKNDTSTSEHDQGQRKKSLTLLYKNGEQRERGKVWGWLGPNTLLIVLLFSPVRPQHEFGQGSKLVWLNRKHHHFQDKSVNMTAHGDTPPDRVFTGTLRETHLIWGRLVIVGQLGVGR